MASGHIGIDHKEVMDLYNGTDKRCEGNGWGYRKISIELGCSVQNIRRHVKSEERKLNNESKETKIGNKTILFNFMHRLSDCELFTIIKENEAEELFRYMNNNDVPIVDHLNNTFGKRSKGVKQSLIKTYMPNLRKNASDANFTTSFDDLMKEVAKLTKLAYNEVLKDAPELINKEGE